MKLMVEMAALEEVLVLDGISLLLVLVDKMAVMERKLVIMSEEVLGPVGAVLDKELQQSLLQMVLRLHYLPEVEVQQVE